MKANTLVNRSGVLDLLSWYAEHFEKSCSSFFLSEKKPVLEGGLRRNPDQSRRGDFRTDQAWK